MYFSELLLWKNRVKEEVYFKLLLDKGELNKDRGLKERGA